MLKKTGSFKTSDGLRLCFEEYGSGKKVILSAMAGLFYPEGLQQAMAEKGYHVYCMTLRGFSPSDYVTEDYGDAWYDVFARDVMELADYLNLPQFFYLGASHGAGAGWHLLWRNPERVKSLCRRCPRTPQSGSRHHVLSPDAPAGDNFLPAAL